jgi:osmotically-inducible protein OsmY
MKTLTTLLVVALCLGACDSGREDEAQQPEVGAQRQPDVTGRETDQEDMTLTPAGESEQDAEVTRQIREALAREASLSETAQQVEVTTAGGVVTLSGSVASAQEKAQVESIAQQKAGTNRVESKLQIGTAGGAQPPAEQPPAGPSPAQP